VLSFAHATYRLLFVSFFVCPQIFCNGYLRRGLTQNDEIWEDGRPGSVASHPIFLNFGLVVSPSARDLYTAAEAVSKSLPSAKE